MATQHLQTGWTRANAVNKLIPIAACIASVLVFFRIQVRTNLHIVFGDRSDGLIQITILEHWWNVVRGKADWATTFFFYPTRGSLGYNDGYLIFGLIYSIFRAAGMDQLLSSDFTNMTIKIAGFAGVFFLSSRFLSMPRWLAVLGASIFTLANNSYANAYHAQLFSIAFVPVFTILMFKLAESIRIGSLRSVICCGIGCTTFYSMWLLTAFYMAWFSAYFALFFIAALILQLNPQERQSWTVAARRSGLGLSIIALIGLFELLPFAHLYGRTAAETGMHPFSEVLQYSPSLFDLFNLGPNNVIFGALDQRLSKQLGPGFPLSGEHVMGLSPVLILLAVIGLVLNVRTVSVVRRFWISAAAAAALSWLLMIHIGSFSVWSFFYHYLPGAKAVRVISRYEIFLTFPLVLLAMEAIRQVILLEGRALSHRYVIAGFCMLLSAFLVAEELNTSWPLGLTRPEELERLALVPAPPQGCKAFYVTSTRSGPPLVPASVDAIYSSNVDAMFIAESISLPTLNGMASFTPTGWNLTHPYDPDYLSRVEAYEAAKGVKSVCQLDLRRLQWTH